jgi:hypothetical protein
MKREYLVVPLFLLLILLVGSGRLRAQEPCTAECTGIEDFGEVPCAGCSDTRPDESCSDTCYCGTCHLHGSSGECCGRIYYVPNFYPAPGDCTNECIGVPAHARTHASRRKLNTQFTVDLRQGSTPGLIMLTPTRSYRDPVFLYALDCSRQYRLVAEENTPSKTGGM